MIRTILVVAPRYQKFLQALMGEDGSCIFTESPKWDSTLAAAASKPNFRVLVAPDECKVPEGVNFFLWSLELKPTEMDYWVSTVMLAVDEGALDNLPSEVLEQLTYLGKCVKALKASRWSEIQLKGNDRFAHLYAYLCGLASLRRLRRSKCWGVKKQEVILGGTAN